MRGNQNFTQKELDEEAWEKEGSTELEEAYDRVNRGVLWQLLRMYSEW